ncbi:PBP1A family penicillin-binding protein [Paracidobacterium acidisoli]|uniref:PBP1A family penicillin-binding protein n=1 Tax=Paracidobacterium acidisoli TaxID=2303751 RepID=A0A372ITE5_9BACT|nr:PBP1A family penicillin-binding protein [Paracidobacterium acidisoli]MBT9329456.1 PBP1A family penicillin-binding protein [Paracidobacterium acidisoli]
MAVKIKVARPATVTNKKLLLGAGIVLAAGFAICLVIFGFYWFKYKSIVDARLQHPLFEDTAKIYAAPREVRPGQKLTSPEVAAELRDAGYSVDGEGKASAMGTYSDGPDAVVIHPGPQSYHSQDGATITFSSGVVSQIKGDNGQQLAAYELEPLLVTGLSGENRSKRRLVTYDELPKYLVPAVTSIEDRRYFDHGGVDYVRLMGAFFNDLRRHRYSQGGSTLTMQLAKDFFLSPEKKFKRKLIQIVIAFQLEHRFNKKQIFQMYANEINLGQRGSFSIDGFGEASQAYFGKDVRQLDLPECALLAGMIQSPNRLNPYRHPQRALERRNLVLDSMVETGAITKEQGEAAKASPLHVVPGAVDAGEAPYFVDLVREQLAQKLGDADYNREGLRIYTSLDPQLEEAATEAITAGMKGVDELVIARHERLARAAAKRGETIPPVTYPQVALVALNPHTGQVLALVGGRNYGNSQFNHAVSHRPTGSIFKPFVYAAAFNTALAGTPLTNSDGASAIFTPVTLLNDEQTTFTFNNQEYTPRDFDNKYYGEITAREALMRSLNNATISLAQMVGFNNVAALARDAGIVSARGTPAMAIGAYDATPLEMAGAYTVFANEGVKIEPWMLASVRSPNGDVVADYSATGKPVLDPRASYLTLSLMESVINHGTGFTVRAMGFTAPAAGKTGTSHDAWFAGFTSNLICVVWVGNDDYTDIKIEGSKAAAPIWAEFMKRAVALPQYSDTKDFIPPPGVIEVNLDKQTNLLADGACPQDYEAAFLDGTQPTDTCDHSTGDQRNLFQKIFGIGQKPVGPAPVQQQAGQPQPAVPAAPVTNNPTQAQNNGLQQPQPPAKKKRGFWSKLFGKHDNGDNNDNQQQQQPPQN